MKLLRYGLRGQEKPGVLDTEGRIRDLSGHVPDIAGDVLSPAGLAKLKALDIAAYPWSRARRGSVPASASSPRSSRSGSTIPTMPRRPALSHRPSRSCS